MKTSDDELDLAVSRAYWRHAPSGAGKHDTSEMLRLGDSELEAVWDDAFTKRFRGYPEENAFLLRMAEEFRGERFLSIGPGIGLHEIFYHSQGSSVTCCDIVPTNLKVIERVAALKGLRDMRFLLSEGPTQDLGGPFDVVFLYGSLMTVPEPMQRDLMQRVLSALAPGGRVVLMLYTWAFARDTCGWSSPDQFDPRVFARASDPSVGDEHCPWSDWHDETKLEALVPGALHVARRQLWNQGWFVWFEMRREKSRETSEFFDPMGLDRDAVVEEIDLKTLDAVTADLSRENGKLWVKTRADNFGYALMTEPLETSAAIRDANAVLINANIAEGGFSVGILDEDQNAFAVAAPFPPSGTDHHVLPVSRMPDRYRVVVSNHRAGDPASSCFLLSRIAFLKRTLAAPPRRSGSGARP